MTEGTATYCSGPHASNTVVCPPSTNAGTKISMGSGAGALDVIALRSEVWDYEFFSVVAVPRHILFGHDGFLFIEAFVCGMEALKEFSSSSRCTNVIGVLAYRLCRYSTSTYGTTPTCVTCVLSTVAGKVLSCRVKACFTSALLTCSTNSIITFTKSCNTVQQCLDEVVLQAPN